MTTPTTTQRQESSLARDLFDAARYYVWRPRVLLTLATIAIIVGLVFNWGWLVAAGIAPILISILPCPIMCAVGACMMCRSGERQSAPVGDAAEAARPPTALAVAATNKPSYGTNSSVPAPHSIEAAAPMSPEYNPPAVVADCCQDGRNDGKVRTDDRSATEPRKERPQCVSKRKSC